MAGLTNSSERKLQYMIGAHQFDAPPIAPGLYCVATPIGNLRDVTLRALETLAAVDRICCEDTRVTKRLLTHYGIQTPLTVYNDHADSGRRTQILDFLDNGESIALVSDAGTPLIADPGYKLVSEVINRGHTVFTIPGANAAIAALSAAGLPTDAFFFGGFLPSKTGQRRKRLAALAAVPGTLVFYESPHRLTDCLADLEGIFAESRETAIARELTKHFEELARGTPGSLLEIFSGRPSIKGEIVILVGPPAEGAHVSVDDVDALLRDHLAQMRLREAVDAVAAMTDTPRKQVYQRALALKDQNTNGSE